MRSDGKLVYSISRSGKSQFVLSQIINDGRVLVWDVEGEYASKVSQFINVTVVSGMADLLECLKANTNNAFIAYQPQNLKEFDFFCRCAFNWSVQSPATIVCEELGSSTNPGKAIGRWGILISRGLKYGTNIYAVIQRGSEGDKSSLGNATVINVCRPNTLDDAKYIAQKFGLNLSDIPDADLESLQRFKDRTLKKSKIVFNQNLPVLKEIDKFTKTWQDKSTKTK